jgi:hypothetical protein
MNPGNPDLVTSASPASLATFFETRDDPARVWRPEELQAIYRHQMSAALQFDLGAEDPALGPKVKALADAQGLLLKSFQDLLYHPNPPLELLKLTKDFAKRHQERPDSPLPREIATVLYFASIAVAMLRCGQRITTLGDAALRKGFEWVLARPWVDERARELMRDGIKALGQ